MRRVRGGGFGSIWQGIGGRCSHRSPDGCVLALLVWLLPGAALATPPQLASTSDGYAPEGHCDGCHQIQAQNWQQSDHSWAMRPAVAGNVLGDFSGAEFSEAGVRARFFREGERYRVSLAGPAEPKRHWTVEYTFGHYPLQQYLVAQPGGRLQALTVAWDSRPAAQGGQRWFSLYPGQSFHPDDPLHWQGRYQNWNAMCADCHSTNLDKGYQAADDSFATTWHELSVGCQSCHGPGQAHIDWAGEEAEKRAQTPGKGLSLSLGTMPGPQLAEQCARCHSRRQTVGVGPQPGQPLLNSALPSLLSPGLYHADGQIQGEVYVYGSFAQSRMHQQGVSCTDCHEPHTSALRFEGNALCTQCHQAAPPERFRTLKAANYDTPTHHHHPQGSSGAQCVNCHMPATTYMVVDPRRDHSFRIPRPDLSAQTGSPDACTGCHDDMTPQQAATAIDRWRPENPAPAPHYGQALAMARAGEAAGLPALQQLVDARQQPAIVRASAVAALIDYGAPALPTLDAALSDPSALVRASAVPVFAQAPDAVRTARLIPLLDDPTLAVRDEAVKALAGVPLAQLGQAQAGYQAALEDYLERLEQNADLPGNRLNLAVVLTRIGQPQQAAAHYRAALAMDPRFLPARLNLVTLLSQMGETAEVSGLLDQGLALSDVADADRAQLGYLKALALAESGQIEAALVWLDRTLKWQPTHLRGHYNRALILDRLGRKEEALAALQQGLVLAPASPDLLYASVYLNATLGNLPQALSDLATLRQLRPDDPKLQRLESQLRGQ
ncbi:tetratricopeptide repeat protein [Ferrimonas balearica]|nr:tetratricopeptide repeat protein [Ferrimonas balearica]